MTIVGRWDVNTGCAVFLHVHTTYIYGMRRGYGLLARRGSFGSIYDAHRPSSSVFCGSPSGSRAFPFSRARLCRSLLGRYEQARVPLCPRCCGINVGRGILDLLVTLYVVQTRVEQGRPCLCWAAFACYALRPHEIPLLVCQRNYAFRC